MAGKNGNTQASEASAGLPAGSDQSESQLPDTGEAPLGVLGARAAGPILIVAATVPLSAQMDEVRRVLESDGHAVSTASHEQSRTALTSIRPGLVVLEADATEEVVSLCSGFNQQGSFVAVLAVMNGEQEADTAWPKLQQAGADDFVPAGTPAKALQSRASLLLRLTQTRRDLETLRERLSRHMQIDEATQLLNRRFFFQNAHRECSRARRYGHPLACLMIEIDYLDEINKTFGYPCVEYVLRAVAYIVRQWTRDSDICGRFSENKFAVLLPETNIDGATMVREKINAALENSQFEWEGQDLPVNVSVGESERKRELSSPDADAPTETLPEDFETEPLSVREELAALLEDADAALSVARRSSLRPEIFTQYTPGIELQ